MWLHILLLRPEHLTQLVVESRLVNTSSVLLLGRLFLRPLL